MIAGPHVISPAYGCDAHDGALWGEFRSAMDSADATAWLYNGTRATPERAADLGYWMGYRIAKAYYGRATDKAAAVPEILFRDPKALLASSGYAGPR